MSESSVRGRLRRILRTAKEQGLLGPRDTTVTGRVPSRLMEKARQKSGAKSVSELLLYALAMVALEDDFSRRLLARKGRTPRGVFTDCG